MEPQTEPQSETLRDLHTASKLNFTQVLAILQQHEPQSAPKTPEAVAMVIKRGTMKSPTLRAMAIAYKKPYPRIEAAAEESRKRFKST